MSIFSYVFARSTKLIGYQYRRLLIAAIVHLVALLPLTTHAALPPTLQAALAKAELSADNISIIVTPVGDNNNSRLPAVINVIDHQANTASHKDTGTTTVTAIDPQALGVQENKRQDNTDDPYTHQSLERVSSVLVIDETRQIRRSETDNTLNQQQDLAPSTSPLSPLVNHNPAILRTPASTMKLIPSFVALDTLGADFVWFTRVYHTGLLINHRLQGDLIIQGSGDPKMTHARLEQLLYQVKKAGIHHIDGDIIIDSSIFYNVSKDPAAFDNAPLRAYNASPDGFLINFNSIGIYTYPLTTAQAQLKYIPQLTDYQLPVSIRTRQASCSQASSSLAPQWQQDQLVFHARLPDGCGEHIFYVNHPDAKEFAARVVAQKWQALDNILTGKVINQQQPYTKDLDAQTLNHYQHSPTGPRALGISPLPIVSYPSYNLAQQIHDINHFSNNVMTEQVALSIGSYAHNDVPINPAKKPKTTSLYQFDGPKSTDYVQALAQIEQWWQNTLNSTPPYLTNSSGLCRNCTVTAENLAELLSYAYDHPSFETYVNSLGVAGISGTISHHSKRLPDSAAIGRAWIKTGTLNNVTAMAGYVKAQSGQDYVVVGIINTQAALNPYIARPVLDTLLDWSAQQ